MAIEIFRLLASETDLEFPPPNSVIAESRALILLAGCLNAVFGAQIEHGSQGRRSTRIQVLTGR